MHIKELQLIGFKSFQEKTTLRLSSGMNAVIGPNGCGKTNIIDALRWVLGEQSFSLLRCSRNEDLIFSGTDSIPAKNYADVRLVLSDDELKHNGSEIELRRRYFRSGESEYFLNRQPCRLKDIQEVFLGSGIGTKAYSIFDLRQMREIIAGNIRKMFEEAATLAKYQDSKADCQRKLELTEADLTRLDDIIAERERVVRSLRRQAGRLRSYQRLKEKEKGFRLFELKAEFDSTGRELERVEKDVAMLEQAEAHRLTEISGLEKELQQHRGRLRQEHSLKDELAETARKAQQKQTKLESQVLLSKQRAQFLKQDADRARKERCELEKGVAVLEQTFNRALESLSKENSGHQELEKALEFAQEQTRRAEKKLYELRRHEQTARESFQNLLEQQHNTRQNVAHFEAVAQNQADAIERFRSETEELGQRISQARDDLTETRQRIVELISAIKNEQERLNGLKLRFASLEEERRQLHQDLSKARDRRNRLEKKLAVLNRTSSLDECRKILGKTILGRISKFLDVDKGWEKACEAALQPVMDFLVTDREPSLEQLTKLIREGPENGCGLVGASKEEPGTPGDFPNDKAIIGRLGDYVKLKDTAPQVVRNIVNSFIVVSDEVEIERLAKIYPDWSFLTKRGCARFADGRFVIGARQGKLREKSEEHKNSVKLLAALSAKEKDTEKRLVEIDRLVEDSKENLSELEQQKASLNARQELFAAKKAELERDMERVRAELNRTASDKHRTIEKLTAERKKLEGLTENVKNQTRVVKKAGEQRKEQEHEAKTKLEEAAQQLANLNEQRHKVSQIETETSYTKQTIEERKHRIAELEKAMNKAEEDSKQIEKETAMLAPQIRKARQEVADAEAKIRQLGIADLAIVEEQLEKKLTEMRHAREQNQNILMEQRLKKHELKQRQAAIVQEAAAEQATDIAQFEPEETTDVTESLAGVRRRLGALGKVNPLAQEEYEQERQDLERLNTQRNDVVSARENLLQTMTEIDRHAREQFLDTYQKVRAEFKNVFRQMFLEGEADLVLVDEKRPLESEIAIVARPGGKNPKRLEQLSDGEKALLAVSLLFAFYRVKPAPFCFLDEVDAPLDDANVGRFAEYLKSISNTTQVVIITHNRLTVQRANALFGVTAQQPGISKLVSVSLADYRTGNA